MAAKTRNVLIVDKIDLVGAKRTDLAALAGTQTAGGVLLALGAFGTLGALSARLAGLIVGIHSSKTSL
jgi:hypothetical protein